ncbi:hypothetical protein ACIBTV_27200 [Micromonospora sp. NPDC049366]|uniref:hypothetical protein n=1 Tax=Micromonospora sp. NPDC049366 TaxID=3364271 RepID=UPI0037B59BAF
MARYWYGMSLADWTLLLTTVGETPNVVQASGGAPITFWNAETGGTQYIDLLDADGAPTTSVLSSTGGNRAIGTIPPLRGPDNIKWMWASAGGGPRMLMAGRVDAVDRNGDQMLGSLLLADGSPAASQAYAVSRAGDTMVGPLSVPTPTAPSHAATKQYVDSLGGGGGGVASVNGETGVVVLDAADVGAAPTAHTHTTSQVSGLDTALAGKAPTAHDHSGKVNGYRWTGSAYVASTNAAVYVGPVDPATLGSVAEGSVWIPVGA